MANKEDCTASPLALAGVLHPSNDILLLFGTPKQNRLKENGEVNQIKLTVEELKKP